jgi:hypothetical protein
MAAIAACKALRAFGTEIDGGQSSLCFTSDSIGKLKSLSLKCRFPIRKNRRPRERRDFFSQRKCVVKCRARRHNLGRKADPLCFGGIDNTPRENQIECSAKSYDSRQSLCSAVNQGYPKAPLGAAELRRFADDPKVTPKSKLKPASNAPAVYCCDHWLRRNPAGKAQGASFRPSTLLKAGDVLQVGAGTEGISALAGQHHQLCVVISDPAFVGGLKCVAGWSVNSVTPLRATDGYYGASAAAFVGD